MKYYHHELMDLPYVLLAEIFRSKDVASESEVLTEKVKSFAGLAGKLFAIRERSYRNRAGQQFVLQL
jgi:hypothetical protein